MIVIIVGCKTAVHLGPLYNSSSKQYVKMIGVLCEQVHELVAVDGSVRLGDGPYDSDLGLELEPITCNPSTCILSLGRAAPLVSSMASDLGLSSSCTSWALRSCGVSALGLEFM
jgi:hypothetical protein